MQINDFKCLVIAAVVLVTVNGVKAQDKLLPIFTPITINPAYAGDNEHTNLHVYSRLQGGVNNNDTILKQSYSALVDGIVNGNPNFAWAAQLTTRIGDKIDDAHIGTTHMGRVTGVWRIPVHGSNSARFNVGASAGVMYKQELNSTHEKGETVPGVVPDFRFGLYYKEANWHFATSVVNLTGNELYAVSSYFTGGGTIRLTDDINLSPSAVFQINFDAKYNEATKEWKRDFTLSGPETQKEFSISATTGFYDKYSFSLSYGQALGDEDHPARSISIAGGIEIAKSIKLNAIYGYGFDDPKPARSVFGLALTTYIGAE